MSSTYVFTLVHGTRLRFVPWRKPDSELASWIRDESSFCNRLRSAFPDDRVVIVPFCWSGRNRAGDRSQAATRLAEQVAANARQYPGALQVVVGHSHGGTVACLALNVKTYAECLSGIVCMSTPFIHIRRREHNLTHELSLVLPACVLLLSLIFAVWMAPPYWLYGAIVGGIGSFLMWVAMHMYFRDPGEYFGPDGQPLVGDLHVSRLPSHQYPYLNIEVTASELFDAIRKDSQQWESSVKDATTLENALLQSVEIPASGQVPVLIVRVAGDEASGILVLARLVAWISAFLAPPSWLLPRHLGHIAFAAVLALILAQLPSAWSTADWIPGLIMGTAIMLVFAVAAASFIGGVAMLVATGIIALPVAIGFLMLLVYGTDLARLVTRFEFSVEETPKGRHLVEQLSFVPHDGLLHSAAYEHPDVPGIVRHWLTNKQSVG